MPKNKSKPKPDFSDVWAGSSTQSEEESARLREKAKYDYYNPPKKKLEHLAESWNLVDMALLAAYDHSDTLLKVPGVPRLAEFAVRHGLLDEGNSSDILGPLARSIKNSDAKYKGANQLRNYASTPDLVSQYFGHGNLEESKYKPKSDYLEFLPTYTTKTKLEPEEIEILNESIKFTDKNVRKFSKGKRGLVDMVKESPLFSGVENTAISTDVDLGSSKTGMAWDEERGLPYVSKSDAWDFEPYSYTKNNAEAGMFYDANLDKVFTDPERLKQVKRGKDRAFAASYLMHKVGKPFKIYDRRYFDPNTLEYIEDK